MRMNRAIKSLRRALALGVLVASIGAETTVSAQQQAADGGAVIDRLPATVAAELRRDIEEARAVDPRPFLRVSEIVHAAPIADAQSQGGKATIALTLAKLGPSGLMPMLEMLAYGPPTDLPHAAVRAIRRDLIEAVGLLRQPRALPVLGAILDDATEDDDTTTSAAEATARLGTDEAATRLIGALDDANYRPDRACAILGGMGECRRLRVAESIVAHLQSTPEEATARVAARSLGRIGNAWAWKTAVDRTEEASVRETAARALVDAFVRRGGDARTAADNALMVVDDPHTPALIAEARKNASPDTMKALDALALRFANNPSR